MIRIHESHIFVLRKIHFKQMKIIADHHQYHFVKATYFLEGDGPLVFACYEKLSAVS